MGAEAEAVVAPQVEPAFQLPPAEAISGTATEISKDTSGSEMQLKLSVGGKVTRLCGGIERYKEDNTYEKQVLEKLTEALFAIECRSWSVSRLRRAARLFEQDRELGDLVKTWPTLDYSHFRAVQGLNWDEQRSLLNWASNPKRRAEELVLEVARTRGKGRLPRAALGAKALRLLRRVANVVDDHDELAAELGEPGILDAEEIAEIVRMMSELEARLDQARAKLEAAKAD